MFCSIMDAVRYHALHTPEKLCVADGIADYSYLTMYEKAGAVATCLQNAGVKQGDRVTVECTQNAYYLICGLACQLLGAIFVPVENKVAIERLKEITASVEAALHIGQTEYQTENQFLDINVLFENLPADADMDEFSSYRDENAIAEILYTTGTTGKPKGIMISNGNNVAVAENILYGTEMKKDSVELIPLPLSHSHGLRSYYAHLINGSSVVLADGVLKVKEIFELMDKYQVTALDLSPSAAKILLKLSKGNFSNYSDKIDYVQIGTAMLGEDVKEDMCRIFSKSRLYNCYGSTESG
ncbi:MAG: AMP-binding protein, partial [Lachnospiraceae bacterium]|nr:AMP-binding protein [Lachnospiraceae bacterium]